MTITLLSLLGALALAQSEGPAAPVAPKPDKRGVYEVASSKLTAISRPTELKLVRGLTGVEVSQQVIVSVIVSPEGKVIKAKAVSGNSAWLGQTAEKIVKEWIFQPYLINGKPVPVRTDLTVDIRNTFDHYRDPNGDVPVRLDEEAARALLLHEISPDYPSDAKAARIQGLVELRVLIGKDGCVHDLLLISGHPMLVLAARKAVRGWTFKPYLQDGKPMPVITKLTVSFKLKL